MCFVHKHMQNADFGQILCRRASTKRHVTSRPMVWFSQTWYQKMRKTWKKKVMKRRVAICGGRGFRAGGGGSNWPPPPPVKIGLNIFHPKVVMCLCSTHLIVSIIMHLKHRSLFFCFLPAAKKEETGSSGARQHPQETQEMMTAERDCNFAYNVFIKPYHAQLWNISD